MLHISLSGGQYDWELETTFERLSRMTYTVNRFEWMIMLCSDTLYV